MPLEFRTHPESGSSTSIGGVGSLAAWGASGIPVDVAAQTMHELQDRYGDPLEGKSLERAARAWAKSRNLAVVDVQDRPPLTRQSQTTGEPDGVADPDAEKQEEAESE